MKSFSAFDKVDLVATVDKLVKEYAELKTIDERYTKIINIERLLSYVLLEHYVKIMVQDYAKS